MTTNTIPHAARCSRPTPTLRLSWQGEPEVWCSACGRYAPASEPVEAVAAPEPKEGR